MSQEIVNIILSALGVVVTGLATLVVTKLTQWLSTKISDTKASNYIFNTTKIVMNCVKETYQTYVEAIKTEGKFDKEAQEKALNMCLEKIKTQLAPEVIDYITKNFGDISEYLKSLIESSIYSLKNNK